MGLTAPPHKHPVARNIQGRLWPIMGYNARDVKDELNYIEHTLSSETDSPQVVRKFSSFMEPKGSLPYSQRACYWSVF
jgi:hypothetical protein